MPALIDPADGDVVWEDPTADTAYVTAFADERLYTFGLSSDTDDNGNDDR